MARGTLKMYSRQHGRKQKVEQVYDGFYRAIMEPLAEKGTDEAHLWAGMVLDRYNSGIYVEPIEDVIAEMMSGTYQVTATDMSVVAPAVIQMVREIEVYARERAERRSMIYSLASRCRGIGFAHVGRELSDYDQGFGFV